MGLFSNMVDAIIKTLGEPGTFIPVHGEMMPVRAVFTEMAEEVDPGGTLVTVRRPRLFVNLASFPRLPQNGDHFLVRSKSYHLTNLVDDGEGGAMLEVQADAP